MAVTLMKLPYAYDALEPFIDEETMKFHHDKHHQTYVNNLNKLVEGTELEGKSAEEILTDLSAVPEKIRQGVINQGGGVYNHDLFWTEWRLKEVLPFLKVSKRRCQEISVRWKILRRSSPLRQQDFSDPDGHGWYGTVISCPSKIHRIRTAQCRKERKPSSGWMCGNMRII